MIKVSIVDLFSTVSGMKNNGVSVQLAKWVTKSYPENTRKETIFL